MILAVELDIKHKIHQQIIYQLSIKNQLWFYRFSAKLPHPVKIVIAGNHDLTFDDDLVINRRDYLKNNFRVTDTNFECLLREYGVSNIKEILTNCVYLEDSSVDVCGIKIFGSPW